MSADRQFAVAEMEQETRRERQAAGIAEAKRQGVYKGRKPSALKVKDFSRAKTLRAKGATLPEVAQALGVTVRTVSRYLAR